MQLTPTDIEEMCARLSLDSETQLVIAFLALVDRSTYYGASCKDCLVSQVAQAIAPLLALTEHPDPTVTVVEWSGANEDEVYFIYGQAAEPEYIFSYGAALEMACEELGVDLDEARALYEAELKHKEKEGVTQ